MTWNAGFCSQANARLIAAPHKGYIFGLKGNRPGLFYEAERVLGALSQPERSSTVEVLVSSSAGAQEGP
jgi:hypothetical protein